MVKAANAKLALMGIGLAARVIGLSTQRVRQLDAVLSPMIMDDGRRVYTRENVEAYAAIRDGRAAMTKKRSIVGTR